MQNNLQATEILFFLENVTIFAFHTCCASHPNSVVKGNVLILQAIKLWLTNVDFMSTLLKICEKWN